MVKIEIRTGGAAFDDGNLEYEVARILRKIANQIENGSTSGAAMDINGNKVGTYEVEVE